MTTVRTSIRDRLYTVIPIAIVLTITATFVVTSVSPPQRPLATTHDTNSHDIHNNFAIIINTYRRHALLLQQLQLYTRCPAVSQVHILWSESPSAPATILDAVRAHKPRVQLHVQWPNRSLNLRFRAPPGLRSQAIVSLDDDIMVSCSDLVRTYQARDK